MSLLPGRLGTLTAQDVMTRTVVVLAESEPVPEAVRKLQKHHITGAPVVDAQGKLVGILSISDLVPWPSDRRKQSAALPMARDPLGRTAWELFAQTHDGREAHDDEERDMALESVGERMSRDVASVNLDDSLVSAARMMCDGHWHRVPVVDRKGSLCGIISTMDVLAAIVNAEDELR